MPIANCAKCNKIYQHNGSPLCSNCVEATRSHVKDVCQFIYEHPGLILEEVATQCQIPVKDLEEMLFSGRLGNAAAYVMFKCQSCPRKMPAKMRKGRFCSDCASKIEAHVLHADREEKEKPKSHRRLPEWRDDEADREPIEATGPVSGDVAQGVETRPTASEPKPTPEAAPKQESASPSSDSYGFKRVKDL